MALYLSSSRLLFRYTNCQAWDVVCELEFFMVLHSCLLFLRWFCHVDDDNYVVLPSLLRLLASYSHTQDVYLGRPSLDHPIEAAERVKSDGSVSCTFFPRVMDVR